MADTTNYGWTKPDVGGNNGTWGTVLNTGLDDIDADLKTVSDVASAALPKAGGTMTGNLATKTATAVRQDKGVVSGAVPLDLSAAQVFTMTISGATTISLTNPVTGEVVQAVILSITNGGTNMTWPLGTEWSGGSAPVLSNAGEDIVVLLSFDGGTTWKGLVAGQSFA